MTKKRSIAPLFNPSGCLTLKAVQLYLEGSLSGEDQKRVMDHLDSCSLCREAAEGLAKGSDPKVINREIATISRKILKKTSGAAVSRSRPPAQRTLIRKVWTYAAAASVILLAVIYFLLRQPHTEYQESMIALNDTVRKDADQMRQSEPVAVPDSRKVTARESIPPGVPQSVEPESQESEPEAAVSEENADAIADAQISSGEISPMTDSTVPVKVTDHSIVVEMKEMVVEEPPSAIKGISVGGVSARREKNAYRTVNADMQRHEGEDVFTIVEQIPGFPGGNDSLSAFLWENLHYPEEALARRTQGTVYLTFVVEKDGSLSDVRVLRGISEACDHEAIRLVTSMPRWLPGRQSNTPVRVQYNLPIQFTLPD
jgi:protein TonB